MTTLHVTAQKLVERHASMQMHGFAFNTACALAFWEGSKARCK